MNCIKKLPWSAGKYIDTRKYYPQDRVYCDGSVFASLREQTGNKPSFTVNSDGTYTVAEGWMLLAPGNTESGSGVSDYNLLENRPSIGGVTLEGNKRPSDLGMYSKEEADEKFETKESAAEADKRVQGMLDGKVDKVEGKGLSSNDFTDAEKAKLAGLKNYDDTQVRELIAGKADLQHQHTVADITDFPELYYDATAFLTSEAYPSDKYEELLEAVKAKKTVYATIDEQGYTSYIFFMSSANSDGSSSRVLLTTIFADGGYLYMNTFVLQQSGMTPLRENISGKVDKEPGKGLSANDLTDERAGKVDKLKMDGRANEYLNGAGTYSRPVRQGYGVSVADDNTVSVDPQVMARQSDVANVAADLAAQKAKEQGDIDRANAAISKEETDRKAAVAALQSLIDILNSDSNVDGSVKKTVADAIAGVVAGAPEDLDTLKEIADYIASDKTGAAQLAAAISQLQTLTEKHTSDIAGNASGVAENKAGVAALKTLTAGHTKSIEDLRIAKQDALVSGTNIKTINGVPVLGSGDIKTPAPTKVSELENDKGFLTEHQSLEGYYQKTEANLDNRVVAEAIVSLAARLDALEGSRGLLGDATAGTVDVRGLTRCRYPLVMLSHGVPAAANVPVNLPDGLPWDGVPAFAGQQYVNLDAASGGLYYASGVDSVADWKQA